MHHLIFMLYLTPSLCALMMIQTGVPTDANIISRFAEYGILGVFAAFLLLLYRQDRKESERRLGNVIEDFRASNEMLVTTLQENMELKGRLIEVIHEIMDRSVCKYENGKKV